MTQTPHPNNWQEARRLRAWELKQAGWRQQAIATALGVSKCAVSQWMRTATHTGRDGLFAQPHTGRPPGLTSAALLRLPDFLSHGAEAYGFRGEVWTCARIAVVIEQEFGVRYHKAHVSRLLKELNWTPQQPIERAAQRDEAVIATWRTDRWPELKNKRRASGAHWFSSTNRASTCCRRLFAPMRLAARRLSCGFSRPAITCRR